MKRALRVVAALLVLLLGAAVAAPWLVPAESWKPALQARVKAATGRDLRIDGAMRLTMLPRLELQAFDVGFSNMPGASAPEMLTLAHLRIVLKLAPLLSGRVVVDRFVLDHPVVALEVDADGRPNWRFDASAAPGAGAAKQEAPRGAMELHFDDVRLQEGVLRYTDRRGGAPFEATGVGITLSLPSLDEAFHAAGRMTWNGESATLDATVAEPRKLLDGGDSAVEARVELAAAQLSWNGTVAASEPPRAAGAVDLRTASLRNLLSWLGHAPDAPAGTFGPLAIHGRVEASRESVSFVDASLALDDLRATGRMEWSLAGPRSGLDATLDIENLNLKPWLPVAAPDSDGGAKMRDGWNDEPFDADVLRAVDARLRLSVGGLVTPRLRTGRGILSARLKDGRLTVDVESLALYDGSVRGTVGIQAQGQGGVAAGCDLRADGVQLAALLHDAADGDWLAGRAAVDLALEGRGRSVRELVGSFDGKGNVDLRDGSIRGINLAAMALNVASAFQKKRDGERTEFRRISGSLRVTDGVLRNEDLTLQSELLQADGAGEVDFGRQRIDYRVSPKFVAPIVGQMTGGTVGMKVPVRIRGPWDDLEFSPDLVGLLKEGAMAPANLLKGASDFTKGLFGR